MNQSPEWLGVVIVLAPIILFIILLIAVRVAFKKADDNSFQALLGEPGEDIAKKKSTSRFILFLTSLTTLTITSCVTSYYFYMKIFPSTPKVDLELGNFTNVLLALGLGVVPYAVNQVKKISL